MPKNFERAALALAKAALNAQQASSPPMPAAPRTRKARVSTGRAVLLGAGLMLAGQALVKSRGREVLDSVRHGLAEKIDSNDEDALEARDDDAADFDEQPDAEGDQDFDDVPEAEEDEEFDHEDDEYGDEPEAEEDQEFDHEDDEYDDEPEAEEDQDPDQEHDEDEGLARRRPQRKATSGRGRS
jgi:hypothetical protein